MKRFKIYFILVAFGILFNTAINHLDVIWNAVKTVADIFSPVLVGAIIAFILNAPIQWISGKLRGAKFKKTWSEDKIHTVSIFITILIVVFVVLLVVLLVVPNTISSLTSAYYAIMEDAPKLLSWMEENGIDTAEVQKILKSVDISSFSNIGSLLSQTFGVASKIAGTIFQLTISCVLALYILFDKRQLKKWALKIAYAFVPEKAPFLVRVYKKLEKSYFDFFTGQIFESCLLGSLMFICLSIARVPYAMLVAVLTLIFAFVPYLGAWFAGGVGCIFIMFDDPKKAILCVVIYMVVQFVENQFIYPRVVGNKVGLSPLMTLASVIVGGSLMGLFGMIFFIPLVAVIRDLSVEKINELDEKNGYVALDERIEEIEQIVADDIEASETKPNKNHINKTKK